MHRVKTLGISVIVFLTGSSLALAQFVPGTWTKVATPPGDIGPCLALLDATVACNNSQDNTRLWWRLTPDAMGSYIHGTWSALPSLPAGYAPIYFGSAVLPTGELIIVGGEYMNGNAVWTNKGAKLDASQTAWTECDSTFLNGTVGNTQTVVLPDGTFMHAQVTTNAVAKLAFPYTCASGVGAYVQVNPPGKPAGDRNYEEGWTLLPATNAHYPSGVLVVDALEEPNAQVMQGVAYNAWTATGNQVTADLEDQNTQELGPMVLRPDGTVIAFGALGGPGNVGFNSIYESISDTWVVAPVSPGGLASEDGPASLLPNGNVLVQLSPGVFTPPSTFFEFDYTANVFHTTSAPPNAPIDPSFVGHMVVLPTGQILWSDFTNDVEVYTSFGTYNPAWAPAIISVNGKKSAFTFSRSATNIPITGTQFNGLSQGAAYGNDNQSATNYPLVRLFTPGVTIYAKTHDHSTMAVATGTVVVSTKFDPPAALTVGLWYMEVIANGISSGPAMVTVTP